MTTYAPTFTPRYRLKYNAAGIVHDIMIRGPRGSNISSMEARGSILYDLFNGFAAQLADDFAWVSAAFCPEDVDVFVPATVPGLTPTGAIALADFTLAERITGTTFSGKASEGRARLTCYGIRWLQLVTPAPANDFKVLSSESTGVASGVTNLNAFAYTNGNLPGSFYQQATIKANDALVKKARRGLIS